MCQQFCQMVAHFRCNLYNCSYYNDITNGCNFLFYAFISLSSYHVSGSHKPIIRGISLFSYIQPFGSCRIYVFHLRVPVVWSVVVVSLYSETTTTRKQIEIPLMMGL
jgi:hypothetical protein